VDFVFSTYACQRLPSELQNNKATGYLFHEYPLNANVFNDVVIMKLGWQVSFLYAIKLFEQQELEYVFEIIILSLISM
jgi:hypothetical protein